MAQASDPQRPGGHDEAGPPVADAVATICQNIPGGSNRASLAAMALLAEQGDAAALGVVEAHLAAGPLSLDYGDRDSDPPPWNLDRGLFPLLARWWRRLGLERERGESLAASWLDNAPLFGSRRFATFTLFTGLAPLLSAEVARPLLAAAAEGDEERRARAVAGLCYAPSEAALDALAALLGDPAERVARAAEAALSLLAYPPSPGSPRSAPSAPDAVVRRLLDVIEAGPPATRRRAVTCFAWFAGVQHRSSIRLPPHLDRVLPALARLLADPDPELQRLAARQIARAGPDLDNLRPSRAAALGLRLPPLDLLALLGHPDPQIVLAALYVAGRHDPAAPPDRAAVAERIIAMLDGLRGEPFAEPAALYALGRLQAVAAIPALAPRLEQPRAPAFVDALLVLARLRHPPAIPHLARLRHDITYQHDAREALEHYDPAVLRAALE